jgi:hypothetical protein
MDFVLLIQEAFKSGHPVTFFQELLIFFIVWRVMKPEVRKHLDGLKNEINRMSNSIEDLASHLKTLETKHESRFECLEKEVLKLKQSKKE